MTKLYAAALLLAGACVAAPALAQTSSRLDDVMKAGKLRVCTPGDYRPFALAKPDGSYEGIDIDLVQSAAKALGVQVEMVKTSWPKLMDDFLEKCDVGVGGISVNTERAKRAGFSAAYMVNGKAPITKCENVAKYQTVADINKPSVTVITNPGGSNERFVRTYLPQAKVVVYDDNVTIFDEILKGRADVMISESVETVVQQKLRPGLCAVNPQRPLQYGEMGWLLPRGDTAMKAWMDTWLHLSKAGGEFDRTVDKWLK
ncbi:transporter substrate-binding domain-containing protein [Piscinibacter sp. XHJ-5]|uniref:transporter substrate-binding domain-containing protein n=1 Tax=Piscinibacter sp. XHJ-5 TaxID=3037797 RepID=UPI0024533C58|nr:transporter substrate-binding domain-containing protein [Piscinibacter sp. XHJ-5]